MKKLALVLEEGEFAEEVVSLLAIKGFSVYRPTSQRIEVKQMFDSRPLENYFTSKKIAELNNVGIRIEEIG